MEKVDKQNKMGMERKGKLLFSMGVPLMISMLVAAFRQIVGVLPAAALMAYVFGAGDFIWAVFPIAEAVSFVAACVFTLKSYKKATRFDEK